MNQGSRRENILKPGDREHYVFSPPPRKKRGEGARHRGEREGEPSSFWMKANVSKLNVNKENCKHRRRAFHRRQGWGDALPKGCRALPTPRFPPGPERPRSPRPPPSGAAGLGRTFYRRGRRRVASLGKNQNKCAPFCCCFVCFLSTCFLGWFSLLLLFCLCVCLLAWWGRFLGFFFERGGLVPPAPGGRASVPRAGGGRDRACPSLPTAPGSSLGAPWSCWCCYL